MRFTLAILSWKCHQTLTNTLRSYRDLGLLELAEERIIFFQEITRADEDIARRFGLRSLGSSLNIGCGPGMLELARASTNPMILLLENDWALVETANDVAGTLEVALDALSQQRVDAVRMRHRTRPGRPFWAARHVKGRELKWRSHLLWSVCWMDDPTTLFPDQIERISSSPDLFRARAQHADFTFNPTLYRTDFLQQLLARFDFNVERPLGHEALVQQWWRTSDLSVAQGDGLFEHRELDTPYWDRLRSISGLNKLRKRFEGLDNLCERVEKSVQSEGRPAR